MYTEVRIVLVAIALILTAVPAWLAGRVISENRAIARSWTPSEGMVTGMAADDWVEIELQGSDGARAQVPIVHKLGLSFQKRVPIYVDPANPTRVRTAGLLQMWLWPAGLVFVAVLLFAGAGAAARLGPKPPLFTPASGIVVQRPVSEWKAPLYWSLLGVACLAIAVFSRAGTQVERLGLGALGLFFLLAMWALALDNMTMLVSVGADGLRRASAFGWRDVRWDEIGSVAEENSIFGRHENRLLYKTDNSFPGRNVTTIVFRDKSGRSILRMSPDMQPEKSMSQLLDTCARKTGLSLESRTVYHPNL